MTPSKSVKHYTLKSDHDTNETEAYSTSTKNLRKIISSDHNMSFISRDQITLNEDNDIMMKFSTFFKIGPITQPFQVNSIDQIQKQRVQSAGYRTLQTQQTEPKLSLNSKSLRAQSAALLVKGQMELMSSLEDAKQTLSNKKKKVRVKVITKQEALQLKLQIFLKLNQEKIEVISKNTRSQQMLYKESKPYIKVYQDKHVLQLIDSMKKQNQDVSRYDKNVTETEQSSVMKTRPITGKQPQQPRLFKGISPIAMTMREKQFKPYKDEGGNEMQRFLDNKDETIHNYGKTKGVLRFKHRLIETMGIVQMPLKYHSALIKVNSLSNFGFTKYRMGQADAVRKSPLINSLF